MKLIKLFIPFSLLLLLLSNTLEFKAETNNDSLNSNISETDSILFFPSIINFSSDSSYGPKINDKAINLKLLSIHNDTFDLYSELAKNKPVLLISGSYTCPAFRNRVPNINKIISEFSEYLNIYIIYTLEAHPNDVNNIYSDKVKPGKINIQENILYPQAKTYNERCEIANLMIDNIPINATILVDNKTNDFITYYGTSPTGSYLISNNGIIIYKELFKRKKASQLYQKLTELYLPKKAK